MENNSTAAEEVTRRGSYLSNSSRKGAQINIPVDARSQKQSSAGAIFAGALGLRSNQNLNRVQSERHQDSTFSFRRGTKGTLPQREVPNFGEGIDQKVLPLPMRATPTDWLNRSPDRNASSGNNIDSKSNSDHVSEYRLGRFASNFLKNSSQSHPLSRIFLDAVERGDKSTVVRCLKCSQPVNVNCTNMLGRTAIQIAVDNENFEIVELLLKEPNIRIGDALLYAIQEGVYRIVEMLINHNSITKEMLGTSWSKRISISEESHDFSADISAVILAAICNQFEILQLLLSRGARIERPHKSNCSCYDCITMNREDSLKYSLWRMNTYRALASPAWISLTSPDPILAAFKLSWELCHLASRENEFKEVFLKLSDQCKKYACDLLDQCRSTEEVMAVLSKSSDDSDDGSRENTEMTQLRRMSSHVYMKNKHDENEDYDRDLSQNLTSKWKTVSQSESTRNVNLKSDQEFHPVDKNIYSQYTINEELENEDGGERTTEAVLGKPSAEVNYFQLENGGKRRLITKPLIQELEMANDRIHIGGTTGNYYECEHNVEDEGIKTEYEEEEDDDGDDINGIHDIPMRLDRLKLAIKYEQKRFVSHPHCQHILTTLWYDQLPGWRKYHPVVKMLFCMGFVVTLPVLAVIYLLYPRGSVGRFLRSPLIKFVNHSASIAIFLILLLIASTDGQSVKALNLRHQTRGPDPNRIECLIVWWVMGFVWSEMKQIWEEGFKAYVRQWWNWLDFIMLTLFLTTVGLRVVSLLLRKTGRYGAELTGRQDWPADDPTLLSEAFFAIAHIFSFARIIFLFQVNEQLGPLQISLGNMLIDITKFLFIFLLVITSFACGLHQLYYYYVTEINDLRPEAFSSLLRSYQALFWHLFGVTPAGQYRLMTKDSTGNMTDLKSGRVTMTVGEILLMIYHAMAIIVLVNMLIAMMSNSFQMIQNQADTEWKFARSKLWLGYFDEGSTLPPPLNTIISPKALWRMIKGLFHLLTCSVKLRRKSATVKPSTSSLGSQFLPSVNQKITADERRHTMPAWGSSGIPTIRLPTLTDDKYPSPMKPPRIRNTYQRVMRILVRRFIHLAKKTMRQGTVNEDDLLEIKQDISSLRYELREDRQRDVVRSIGHLESLKRQLISTLSYSNKNTQDTPKQQSTSVSTNSGSGSETTASTTIKMQPTSECDQVIHLSAFGGQMQTLYEELKRMALTNTSSTASNQPETAEVIHQMKAEIISEMKVELHSFAEQLINYMQQQNTCLEQKIKESVNSESSASTNVAGSKILEVSSVERWQPQTVPVIPFVKMRERIGGVSVPFIADTGGLALPGAHRIQWLKKREPGSFNVLNTISRNNQNDEDIEK